MNAHTPTPWTHTPMQDTIWANDGETKVATIAGLPWKENPVTGKRGSDYETEMANAEFICRAVNSHDALLAACQELLSMVDELLPLAPKGCRWGTLSTDDARQAIALATRNEIPAPATMAWGNRSISTPAVSENLNQAL